MLLMAALEQTLECFKLSQYRQAKDVVVYFNGPPESSSFSFIIFLPVGQMYSGS